MSYSLKFPHVNLLCCHIFYSALFHFFLKINNWFIINLVMGIDHSNHFTIWTLLLFWKLGCHLHMVTWIIVVNLFFLIKITSTKSIKFFCLDMDEIYLKYSSMFMLIYSSNNMFGSTRILKKKHFSKSRLKK
jgi:hypothetical protein